jgi:hypothetical protein
VFDGANFSRVRFHKVTFFGHAGFEEVTFVGEALFDGVAGLETAVVHGVRVVPVVAFVLREWPLAWQVEVCADGWQTLRLAVAPDDGHAATSGPTSDAAG